MPEVSGTDRCVSAIPPTVPIIPTHNNSNSLGKTRSARSSHFGKSIAGYDSEALPDEISYRELVEGKEEWVYGFGNQSSKTDDTHCLWSDPFECSRSSSRTVPVAVN